MALSDDDGDDEAGPAGRLHHIGVGRTHAGTRVLMLIQDLNIRIINAATAELIRELTLDPTRDGLPTPRRPTRPQKEKTRTLIVGSGYSNVVTHHRVRPKGFEPLTF